HPLSRSDAVPYCLNQCAPGGTRTPNLLIRSQMLYPLSYGRLSADLAGGPQSMLPPRGERREPRVVGCATPGPATEPGRRPRQQVSDISSSGSSMASAVPSSMSSASSGIPSASSDISSVAQSVAMSSAVISSEGSGVMSSPSPDPAPQPASASAAARPSAAQVLRAVVALIPSPPSRAGTFPSWADGGASRRPRTPARAARSPRRGRVGAPPRSAGDP